MSVFVGICYRAYFSEKVIVLFLILNSCKPNNFQQFLKAAFIPPVFFFRLKDVCGYFLKYSRCSLFSHHSVHSSKIARISSQFIIKKIKTLVKYQSGLNPKIFPKFAFLHYGKPYSVSESVSSFQLYFFYLRERLYKVCYECPQFQLESQTNPATSIFHFNFKKPCWQQILVKTTDKTEALQCNINVFAAFN